MGHRVNTVYVIAVISSINCGVDVLCLRAVEPDLRYYTQDACIVSLNRLIARAKHDTTHQLDWRCVPADSRSPTVPGGLIVSQMPTSKLAGFSAFWKFVFAGGALGDCA